jgi:prolyl-tRNA synthetase
MGALVMTHSDDQGLVFPELSAYTSGDCSYIQTDEQLESISAEVNSLIAFYGNYIFCKFDNRTTQNQVLNSQNGN